MLPAVILAGGRGSRFKELTDEVPKPLWMLPGRTTILEEIIKRLTQARVSEIYVTCAYLADIICRYIKPRYPRCGLVLQDIAINTPVDAILAMEHSLANDFLVVHGDHWFSLNPFPDLLSRHATGDVTFLIENPAQTRKTGYDIQCIKDTTSNELNYLFPRSTAHVESPHLEWVRLIDGCHVLPQKTFSIIRQARAAGEGMSGMRDLFRYIAERGITKMRGVPLVGSWENINDQPAYGRTVRRIYDEL